MAFQKVLLAVDPQGEGDAKVFKRALSLVENQGAQLMIIGCLKPSTSAEIDDRVGTLADPNSSASQAARQHRQAVEKEYSQAWIEGLANEARERGADVSVIVEVGKPGLQICRLAEHWDADVIVLGRTRRGRLADRLLGSVTHHVVHHAPCSVLMVHD